jgi:hypothetical protein
MTFYGQLFNGKLQFKRGNFSEAALSLERAEQMIVSVNEENG